MGTLKSIPSTFTILLRKQVDTSEKDRTPLIGQDALANQSRPEKQVHTSENDRTPLIRDSTPLVVASALDLA